MVRIFSDRADRFVQRIFTRPKPAPSPEQAPQIDPTKLLHTLRRRRSEISQTRRRI